MGVPVVRRPGVDQFDEPHATFAQSPGEVKGGIAYGESDEHGVKVAKNGVHVHDLHATVLHLMGLDHEKLTYYSHSGRDYRLTDVAGKVVRGVLA